MTSPALSPPGALSLAFLQDRYMSAVSDHINTAVAAMQADWSPQREAIGERISVLEREIAYAEQTGQPVNLTWLAQEGRLKALLQTIDDTTYVFGQQAQEVIGATQDTAIDLATEAAQAALQASVPPGVSYTFGVPAQGALDAMASALDDSSPLSGLLAGFGADAAASAQQVLYAGVALGQSAYQIGSALREATDMTYRRAETIARTEVMRSYRSAQLANYQANSDVVQAWQWSCSFSDRTCSACLAMDGTIHDLSETLDDHVNGRCAMLPVTGSWASILAQAGMSADDLPLDLLDTSAGLWASNGGETGEEWFARQEPAVQARIVGPAKLSAMQHGDITLKDLAGIRPAANGYNASIYERSLRELGFNARDYLTTYPLPGEIVGATAGLDHEAERAAAEAAGAVERVASTATASTETTVTYANDAVRDKIAATLGQPISDEQLANLAGAPGGSQVEVNKWGEITVTRPDGITSSTHIQDSEAGPMLLNWQYMAPDGSNSLPVDAESLAQQVREANALGLDHIHMKARGDSLDYAELPLLGYDAPIGVALVESASKELPEEALGARALSDVLMTPEGRAWWQANGQNPGFDFDLTRGSYSWNTLDAYLREHGMAGLDEAAGAAGASASAAREAAIAPSAHLWAELGVRSDYVGQLELDARNARQALRDAQVFAKTDLERQAFADADPKLLAQYQRAQRDLPGLQAAYDAIDARYGTAGRQGNLLGALDERALNRASTKLEQAQERLADLRAAIIGDATSAEAVAQHAAVRDAQAAIARIDAELADQRAALRGLQAQITEARADLEPLTVTTGDTTATFSDIGGIPPYNPDNDIQGFAGRPRESPNELSALISQNLELVPNADGTALIDPRAVPLGDALTQNDAFAALAAAQSRTPQELAADLLAAWADSSADSAESLAAQMAARDELGLDAQIVASKANMDAATAYYEENGAALRAFQRAQYEQTQQWFADHGITDVEVYRGLGWTADTPLGDMPAVDWGAAATDGFAAAPGRGEIDIASNPISSWSANPAIAWHHAQQGSENDYQLMIAARIPVSRVLSVAQTGYGGLVEAEVTVLGSVDDTVRYEAVGISAADSRVVAPDVEAAAAATRTAEGTTTATEASDAANLDNAAFSVARAENDYHRTVTASYDLTTDDQVFAQRVKNQIGQLDQSALTHTDALTIGAQVHTRISSDDALVQFQSYAQEAADMLAKGPGNFTPDELAWAKSDPDAVAAHGGVSFFEASSRAQAEYQARVAAYLEEIRPVGGDIKIAARGGSRVSERVFDGIESVQARIPSDWIDASNDLGSLTINEVGQRVKYGGYYSPFANGNGRIAVDVSMVRDASMQSTFLHEMMHRMEQAIPQISQLERDFYEMRTAGDELVPLTNGISQMTKLDQWVNEYLGREPIDYSPWGVNMTSYELLSVGAEAALGGGATYDLNALRQDDQFMAFILGLLAIVRADGGVAQ